MKSFIKMFCVLSVSLFASGCAISTYPYEGYSTYSYSYSYPYDSYTDTNIYHYETNNYKIVQPTKVINNTIIKKEPPKKTVKKVEKKNPEPKKQVKNTDKKKQHPKKTVKKEEPKKNNSMAKKENKQPKKTAVNSIPIKKAVQPNIVTAKKSG